MVHKAQKHIINIQTDHIHFNNIIF